jgi:hypothetical protein
MQRYGAQERTHEQLVLVRAVLGNKRTVEKSERAQVAQRQSNIAKWTSIVSAVTAVGALIVSIVALVRSS